MNGQAALTPHVLEFSGRSHGNFIDGAWRQVASRRFIPVFDPANGLQIGEIADSEPADVDEAVGAARRALYAQSWRMLSPSERERLLHKLADKLEEHADEFAAIECLDNGMPWTMARMMNVPGSVGVLRYMAGWPSKIAGKTVDVGMPDRRPYQGFTFKEPLGVIGAIVPWNVPLMLAVWKLAPALAAGCTVVMKPSEVASLSALRLAKLATDVGFPNGVFNVVTGKGSVAGDALVRHKDVAKVTFTGSTKTGKHVARTAAESLKKVTLELGGKSPGLIFNDADLNEAIQGAANAIFTNSGQICVACSRLYVQREVYDHVVEGIARVADSLIVGGAFESAVQMGPLISSAQLKNVSSITSRALLSGAVRATQRRDVDSTGYFYPPTVLAGVQQESEAAREEIFGPVLSVIPFDDAEQGLSLANDSEYGLAAYIWSSDLKTVYRTASGVRAGKVVVNHGGFPYPSLPEGGTKQSGYGRDLGEESIEGFLETKSVVIGL
jgi:phenylacetaldehyde dehydrogenase